MTASRCIEMFWLDHVTRIAMTEEAATLDFEPLKREVHRLKMESVAMCTAELLRQRVQRAPHDKADGGRAVELTTVFSLCENPGCGKQTQLLTVHKT